MEHDGTWSHLINNAHSWHTNHRSCLPVLFLPTILSMHPPCSWIAVPPLNFRDEPAHKSLAPPASFDMPFVANTPQS